MSKQEKFKIELGSLLEVPCFERHSRGKNWMAVIRKDPHKPGGLHRNFQDKSNGVYYYDVEGLEINDPVEFGADYYSCGGNPKRTRWYGVIKTITEKEISIVEYDTAIQAIDAANKAKESKEGILKTLLEEKERLEKELSRINNKIEELKKSAEENTPNDIHEKFGPTESERV